VVNQVPVYLAHTTYQRFEDKDVVLAAVTQNGQRECCPFGIPIGGLSLEFASNDMKMDGEIILTAVKKLSRRGQR